MRCATMKFRKRKQQLQHYGNLTNNIQESNHDYCIQRVSQLVHCFRYIKFIISHPLGRQQQLMLTRVTYLHTRSVINTMEVQTTKTTQIQCLNRLDMHCNQRCGVFWGVCVCFCFIYLSIYLFIFCIDVSVVYAQSISNQDFEMPTQYI